MPNPGAFQGSHKEFLNGKKQDFARLVTFGYSTELLSTIQCEYFKQYPVDLPHNEEPSAEHLAAVDDDAPDPDIEEPDKKTMTAEEYQLATARIAERRQLVTKRRAQIKRWFIYQYMKDHDGDPRDQRARSPYQAYLAKIRGNDCNKPRRKSTVNVWHKFHRTEIDSLAKLTAEKEGISKSGMASLRDKIAHDLFEALPAHEQKEWTNISVDKHKQVLDEWNKGRNEPVSTDPADRQLAIQNLVCFVQPVLDVIADSTGWKVSLFAGGPEPAQEGMLNVISVHSGTTSGDVKLSFGQAEHGSIKKDFIPSFGSFLRKCYTPEECRARALSDLEGFVPISDMEMEGGDAMVHSLEDVVASTSEVSDSSAQSIPSAGIVAASAASQAVIRDPSVQSVVASQTSPAVVDVQVPLQPAVQRSKAAHRNVSTASGKGATVPPASGTADKNADTVIPSSMPIQPNNTSMTVSTERGVAATHARAIADNTADSPSSTGAIQSKSAAAHSGSSTDSEDNDSPFPVSYRLPSETPPLLTLAEGPLGLPALCSPLPSPIIAQSRACSPPASHLPPPSPTMTPLPPHSPPPSPTMAPSLLPPAPTNLHAGEHSAPMCSSAVRTGPEGSGAPSKSVGVSAAKEKTAKAISLEEEIAKKNSQAKKQALEVAEEMATEENLVAKKLRKSSKKKAPRG